MMPCQKELMAAGKPYQRTCQVCGLFGRCQKEGTAETRNASNPAVSRPKQEAPVAESLAWSQEVVEALRKRHFDGFYLPDLRWAEFPGKSYDMDPKAIWNDAYGCGFGNAETAARSWVAPPDSVTEESTRSSIPEELFPPLSEVSDLVRARLEAHSIDEVSTNCAHDYKMWLGDREDTEDGLWCWQSATVRAIELYGEAGAHIEGVEPFEEKTPAGVQSADAADTTYQGNSIVPNSSPVSLLDEEVREAWKTWFEDDAFRSSLETWKAAITWYQSQIRANNTQEPNVRSNATTGSEAGGGK